MNFRSEPTDLRVLLVEDDFASVSMFTDILKMHFGFEICSVNTLEEASNKLESFSPELLILDINLPDGNSINFLKELYQKGFPEFKVIFTTAYANYAVEAFRLSALDFLLKPIAPQNLIASVEKVLKNISAENYRKQLETLFLNDRQPKDKKIVLKTQDDIHVVALQDIIHAQADNNYTIFYLTNLKKVLVSKPLKKFENDLSKYGFLRTHQSHLINSAHIISYHRKKQCVVLHGNIEVPVAQNRKQVLLNFFNEF